MTRVYIDDNVKCRCGAVVGRLELHDDEEGAPQARKFRPVLALQPLGRDQDGLPCFGTRDSARTGGHTLRTRPIGWPTGSTRGRRMSVMDAAHDIRRALSGAYVYCPNCGKGQAVRA